MNMNARVGVLRWVFSDAMHRVGHMGAIRMITNNLEVLVLTLQS